LNEKWRIFIEIRQKGKEINFRLVPFRDRAQFSALFFRVVVPIVIEKMFFLGGLDRMELKLSQGCALKKMWESLY
jgi:hypothetical protein